MILLVLPFQYTTGLHHPYMPAWRIERIDIRYQELLENGYFQFNNVSHTLGYPLYFPFLMKFLGITNAETFHCIFQTWMAAGIIFVYPYLIYKCLNSVFIAMLSPILIRFTFADCLYINKSNEYFTCLWAFVIALPILFLLYKEEKRKRIIWFSVLLGIIMSVANMMRGQSGAGVLAVAIVILLIKIWKKELNWVIAAGCIAFIVFTYNLLGIVIPDIVGRMWGVGGVTLWNTSPWHTMLAGMGYIPNDYGLKYLDRAIYDLIEMKYPDVVIASDEYFRYCKETAILIIKSDPIFVLRGLWAKFLAVLKIRRDYLLGIDESVSEISYIPLLCINIILVVVNIKLKSFREILKEYLPLIIVAISLSILYTYPGILVDPFQWFMLAGVVGPGIVTVFILFILLKGILVRIKF